LNVTEIPDIGIRQSIMPDTDVDKKNWRRVCGRLKKQPLCDGLPESHKYAPVEFKPVRTERARFCAHKRGGKSLFQFRYASHKKI
jgi:hypothetical protein